MTDTPSKSRKKTPKSVIARQEILSAAARKMRQAGYAEMSLRDLAAEVGMKAGSLYYHFPSKDALATEVMRLGVEVVQQEVHAALKRCQDASPRDRIAVAMLVHLETLLSASDFSSAHIRCYPFVPEAVRKELTAVRRAYDKDWNDLIAAWLNEPPDSAKVRNVRHALLGALNWSLEWFDPDRDDVKAYIDTLTKLMLP